MEEEVLSTALLSRSIAECSLTDGGTNLRELANVVALVIQKAMQVRIDYFACSSAEAINHLWKFLKSHLRFLKPENVMSISCGKNSLCKCQNTSEGVGQQKEFKAGRFREFVQGLWKCTWTRRFIRRRECLGVDIF